MFRSSQLAYFVKVAERGQISAAADALYIAQPALSQSISRLERQLGIELFVRHPRGVSLTPAGAAFLDKARAVVDAEADASATAAILARADRAALEIGFLGSPPPLTVPGVLDAFRLAQPHAELSFRELSFPTVPAEDWLAGTDVAICFSPTPHDGVQVQPLWEERRSLLLRSSHPLADRAELPVADLLDEPFCRCADTVDPGWAGQWTLDDHRGEPPVLVTNDKPTNSLELVAALLGGRGISALPWNVAQTIASVASDLVAVPIAGACPTTCSLVWRTTAQNPLTREFVDAARHAVGAGLATHELAAAPQPPGNPGSRITDRSSRGVQDTPNGGVGIAAATGSAGY